MIPISMKTLRPTKDDCGGAGGGGVLVWYKPKRFPKEKPYWTIHTLDSVLSHMQDYPYWARFPNKPRSRK